MSLKAYLKKYPSYQQYDDKTLTEALYKKYGKKDETYIDFARNINAVGATDDSITEKDIEREEMQITSGKAFIAARNTPEQTFSDEHGNKYKGDVGEPGLAYAANESLKQNIKTNIQLVKQAGFNPPEIPKPEYSIGRELGAVYEGTKRTIRNTVIGGLNQAELAARGKDMRSNEIAMVGYEFMSPTEIAQFRMDVNELSAELGRPVTENEEINLRQEFRRKNNEEFIKTIGITRKYIQKQIELDPKYLQSAGFWEDLLLMGPQVAGQVLTTMMGGPMAGMMGMGLMISGATYEDLIKQGASPERAMSAGFMNMIMQGPLEAVGVSKFTKFLKLKKQMLKQLHRLGTSMGTEWLTEFLQAHPESITAIWGMGADKSYYEMFNEYAEGFQKTLKDGAYEGFVAMTLFGLGGGIKMGGQIILPDQKTKNKKEKERLTKHLKQKMRLIPQLKS